MLRRCIPCQPELNCRTARSATRPTASLRDFGVEFGIGAWNAMEGPVAERAMDSTRCVRFERTQRGASRHWWPAALRERPLEDPRRTWRHCRRHGPTAPSCCQRSPVSATRSPVERRDRSPRLGSPRSLVDRIRRAGRALQKRLTQAVRAVRDDPADATALLELAAATADHIAHFGCSAACVVPRFERQRSHFWEGACHDVVGRSSRALACYERFVAETTGVRRLRKLAGLAGHRIHALRRPT